MDAIGIILTTPSGSVIHMGDWTITNDPIDPKPVTYHHLANLPRPTTLMLESLGALKKGLPPSEREVHENFAQRPFVLAARVLDRLRFFVPHPA